jgi:hypothetical protein
MYIQDVLRFASVLDLRLLRREGNGSCCSSPKIAMEPFRASVMAGGEIAVWRGFESVLGRFRAD